MRGRRGGGAVSKGEKVAFALGFMFVGALLGILALVAAVGGF